MLKKEIIIRKARIKDEKGIYNIQARAIREICSQSYTNEQINMWVFVANENIKWVLPMIESELHHCYVAEKMGQIIGFGALFMNLECLREKNIKYFCDLEELYVDPDYLRQGVGSSLLAKLEDIGKNSNCELIVAYPFFNSVTFLQKLGYEIKKKSRYFRHENIEIERFTAQKYLL